MTAAQLVEQGLTLAARITTHDATLIGQAADLFRRATELDPTLAVAYVNLGTMLWMSGDPRAIATFRTALTLQPDLAQAHLNLGVLLAEANNLPEAIQHFRAGLVTAPDSAYGHSNLGIVYRQIGARELALDAFQTAATLAPDEALHRYNCADGLLVLGRFSEGWAAYEASRTEPAPDARRWRGEAVEHLLIQHDQGIGDTIQACRYLDAASQRCQRLTFVVPESLRALMQSSFASNATITVTTSLPVVYDRSAFVTSLPGLFAAGIDPIPDQPYLSIPRSEAWQQRCQALPGLKVGIVWQGNVEAPCDRRRSINPDLLDDLLAIDGVRFVVLQQEYLYTDRRFEHPAMHDWADTAAIIQELDLIIAVDTAVTHLAGALGKPVWLLNRFDTCWRWQLDRRDSPWYPSLRIIRQPTHGDWRSVIATVVTDLSELVSN